MVYSKKVHEIHQQVCTDPTSYVCLQTVSVVRLNRSHIFLLCLLYSWLRGAVVERRSVTDELSLSYARPATDR